MSSRHAPPLFVADNGLAQTLVRLELSQNDEDRKRREGFIQDLVHNHPAIIPMAEIEPAMAPLVSVCRELPVDGYSADNLWITPWGGVVIGECKLVRNPQARREVVAQVLDYAQIIAGWSYQNLENAARQASKDPTLQLWSLVENHTDLDESQFHDAVERRLRMGRLLLLIIGDGIREGLEALTSYLQLHAGIHAGLALLDLSVWRGLEGGLLIVPRIPMKTVLIERGIVTLEQAGTIRIGPGQAAPAASPPVAPTQSEDQYFDTLERRRPEVVGQLRAFLASLGEIGVSPEYQRSVVLRPSFSPAVTASAGYVRADGKVSVANSYWWADKQGHAEVAQRYLEMVAAIVGGTIRQSEKNPPEVLNKDGSMLDVTSLLKDPAAWKKAIAQFAEDLRSATTA